MAHRRDFYLYKRHMKKGDYWYVCFLDRETGKQMTAKSIDCLKEKLGILDFKSVTRIEEAAIIANKAIEKGIVFSKKRDMLFSSYCEEFWDYENSEYISLRNRLKKNSIGREYAYNMKKNFQKNVKPLIPDGLKISCVTITVLDRIVKELYKTKKENTTISIIIYSFSIPLKEAYRIGLISSNPSSKLLIAKDEAKERGTLTLDEVIKLRRALEIHKDSIGKTQYLAILLSLVTGMRIAEVRALRRENIESCSVKGFFRINIVHSVGYISGLKETKGKYGRSILICDSLANALINNANEEGIIFPSPFREKEYISSPTIRNSFYYLLSVIGITEDIRKKRNITYHSLRHTFSTLGRDFSLSQEDRMLVLGHKSKEINNHYTHTSDEALKRVCKLTDFIYSLDAEKNA